MVTRSGSIGTLGVGTISAEVDQGMIARATLQGAGSLSVNYFKPPASASFTGAGSLSVDAAITQVNYLHPDADDADGSWTNESGNATNLFASIDESWPAVDTDFIQSVRDPSTDTCRVRMSDPSGTLADPTRVRIKYYSRGDPGKLVVRLKQGASEIAAWTYTPVPIEPTVSVETLTAPQLAAISDPTDLFLQFEASLAVYVGPGDVMPGATAWWGLRAYTLASVGANAIRLREDGGNTEQDFATITGGGLDLAAIASFAGANNLFVVRVYDQAGIVDLTQVTAGNQPAFILSGLGSLPVMRFAAASSQFLASMIVPSTPQPMTFSMVAKRTSGTGQQDTLIWNIQTGFTGSNLMYMYAGGSVPTASQTDNVMHAFQFVFNGASSDLNVDGTVNTLNPTGGAGGSGGVLFPNPNVNGDIVEGGAWGSAFSAGNSSSMSANQHGYWGF